MKSRAQKSTATLRKICDFWERGQKEKAVGHYSDRNENWRSKSSGAGELHRLHAVNSAP
jgi:hypothetical protein